MRKYIGTGFLALGASSVAASPEEAASPFDKNRNGMVLGEFFCFVALNQYVSFGIFSFICTDLP